MRVLLLALLVVPPFGLVGLAAPGVAQEEDAPQRDWMVHMDRASGEWRFLPDRIVLVPGGRVQLMVFGDGQFSLVLDDAPERAAIIDSPSGTIRTAEFDAPATPGDYPFHDRYHPEARGVLLVREAETPAASPVIGVVPGGYESRFAPVRLEVDAGATVTFRANGSFAHNLQAADGSFSAGDLQPGGSSTFAAPTTPGEHPFVCRFHEAQGMTGILVVRGAAASPATTPEASLAPPHEPAPREVRALALGGILATLAVGAAIARRR